MGEIIDLQARRPAGHATILADAPERQFSCIAQIIGHLEQMLARLLAGIAVLPEGEDRERLLRQRAAIEGNIARAHRDLAAARRAFSEAQGDWGTASS